jgi:small subunit ribosomal protein S20
MANVHAAIKEIRKSAKKRARNQSAASELKTLWRKLTSLGSKEAAEAKSLAQRLVSKWDRSVSAGIVPKQRANRKKARIAALLNKLSRSR